MSLLKKRHQIKFSRELYKKVSSEDSQHEKLNSLFTKLEKILKLIIANNIGEFNWNYLKQYFKSDRNFKGTASNTKECREFILSSGKWTLGNSLYFLFDEKLNLSKDIFGKDIQKQLEDEREYLLKLNQLRNAHLHEDGIILQKDDYDRLVWFLGILVDRDLTTKDHRMSAKNYLYFGCALVFLLAVGTYSMFLITVSQLENSYINSIPLPPSEIEMYNPDSEIFHRSILTENSVIFEEIKKNQSTLLLLHAEMGKGKSFFASNLLENNPELYYVSQDNYRNISFEEGNTYIIDQNIFTDYEYVAEVISFVETSLANNPGIRIILLTRCLEANEIKSGMNRYLSSLDVSDYHLKIEPNKSPTLLASTLLSLYEFEQIPLSIQESINISRKIFESSLLFNSAANLKTTLPISLNLGSESLNATVFQGIMKSDPSSVSLQKETLKQFILKYSEAIEQNEELIINQNAQLTIYEGKKFHSFSEYNLIKATGLYSLNHETGKIKLSPAVSIQYLISEITFGDYLVSLFLN